MALKKVVNLHATWCGPCKQFGPVFNTVANDEKYNNIEFNRIDIESDEGTPLVEKFRIKSIPTTLLLDENDEVISKVMGSMLETDLRDLIESNL